MLLIRPQTVDDAVLISSNIIETAPTPWSNATTYAVGEQVGVVTGTTIQLYKSLADANLNHDPVSAFTWWVEDGVTYSIWSNSTIYALADKVIDVAGHKLYESLSGGTSHTVSMTIASPCVITWTAHGLSAGTPILFTTTGALATGLTAGTVYYVLAPATDTFNIAATAGGAAINTSGSQSGTHTAIANPNKNIDPTDAANADFWLDDGPTNKWAMYDSLNATVTSHPYEIDAKFMLSGRVDALALLNMSNAVAARVQATTAPDGLVYDMTFNLFADENVSNWYEYFFADIETRNTLLVTDLPNYIDMIVSVSIFGDGANDVSCGILSVGTKKDLGETQHDGAQIGITDYSRKDVDDFGNYTIVKRPFSKRGNFQMRVSKAAVDGLHSTLADYRAFPAVYSASEDYGSTMIFGFFRDFNIEIDYPLESLVSIEIEGLT